MSGVKVYAPASVANLAVGFDILGLAVDAPGDEVIAKLVDKPGVHITKIHGDGGKLPMNPLHNTATYGAVKLIESLGKDADGVGVALEIFKKMPFGSGLGSSAASAVAGVVACNEVLGRPYSKRDLLPFTVLGESRADGAMHADNVAPSLLGGITLINDVEQFTITRLPVPAGLNIVVIFPQISILTKDARDALSDRVTLSAHIRQSSHLASFISALYTSDLDLLAQSLHDVLIEPQRKKLIPHFDEVKKGAMENGALGCSISGAGPTIFAVTKNTIEAENVGQSMSRVLKDNGVPYKLFISPINQEGAIVY